MTGLDALKTATWNLHVQAERSGIIADILSGQADQFGVALLLRALLPVYQVLDASCFGHPALVRAAAIEHDLRLLSPGTEVPLLPEGTAYADRVRQSRDALVAHAYVRYLGDLNGGRILQRRLAASLGAVAHALAFPAYPQIEDPKSFTRDYRIRLNEAAEAVSFDLLAAEATAAFEMNIRLSEAVKAAA